MALKRDFYAEIFEKEEKWIELINKNLLNSIYCTLTLKPFYVNKREMLNKEYELTNNELLGQVLNSIDQILNKIEYFNNQYIKFQNISISDLLPLFLINKMNNSLKKEDITLNNEELNKLNIKRAILNEKLYKYRMSNNNNNLQDYVYDDFPDNEVEYTKKAA